MTNFLASHPKQSPKKRITFRLVDGCKTTRFQPNEFKGDSHDINPNLIKKEPIPKVEWWDMPILRSDNYVGVANNVGNIEDNLKMEKITVYVQHPEPLAESLSSIPPQPIRLTSKERKKLRTQRRLVREKDRREMIREGLMEASKDKVKMSNHFKTAGFEVVQEPTKSEKMIRKMTAERVQAHVDRNVARKLTPAECSEKKKRKLFHDANCLDTIVSVYRINDQVSQQNRFKVDINAQQNQLTGCLVRFKDFSVVVVEGGSKSIKRYRKLMLGLVNWSANSETGENEEKPANKCVLVWQGSVDKPSFIKFSVHHCRTQAASREVFSTGDVEHYWDLAAGFSNDQL